MLNVIKMDLLRMKKSKSTFVTVLILAILTTFTIYMLKIESEGAFDQYTQEMTQADEEGQNMGITISLGDSEFSVATAILILFSSGTMLLFTGIYVVIFVAGERSSGFIKNIAGGVRHRWFLIASKNVALAVYVLLETATVLAVTTLCCKLFMGDVALGFTKEFWLAFSLQFLLHLGFAFLCICIGTISKSKVVGIILCICLATGMGRMLVSYVDTLFEGMHLKVFEYLLTSNISSLTEQSANTITWRILLVVFSGFVVYNVISSIVMEKRDIR